MDVNGAGLDINIVAPDGFEQGFARENLSRRFHQHTEQAKFGGAEMNVIVAAKNLFFDQIHANVFKHELFMLNQFRSAAQIGFDPSHEFGNGKGFGYVIVRTGGKPPDFVFFLAFGGKHDDRDILNVRFAANKLANFDAGHLGQHPVEQNDRRTMFFNLGQRLVAARFPDDFVPFLLQVVFQEQG